MKNLGYITGSDLLLWHASFHLLPSLFFFKARIQKDKDRRKDGGKSKGRPLKKWGVLVAFKLDSLVGVE